MFETYDLKSFGKRIKAIRIQLGYTQSDVTKATSINIDTLRKIENGYSVPRYDTLIHLSSFYKIDLIKKLSVYKSSDILLNFYTNLDKLIANGKNSEIEKQYRLFLDELNTTDDLHLVSASTMEQLACFIKALCASYSNDRKDWAIAYETICHALRLGNADFTPENFKSYRYTYFELRILLLLAANLGDMRQCELSNEISLYLLEAIDHSIYSTKGEDILIAKCYTQLSYNHHRLNNFKQSRDNASKGIAYCIDKGNMYILAYLYFRKGIAEWFLNDAEYKNSLSKSLDLHAIQNNTTQKNHYHRVIKEHYKIDLA